MGHIYFVIFKYLQNGLICSLLFFFSFVIPVSKPYLIFRIFILPSYLQFTEYILGENHEDTIYEIRYRGAVYADTNVYQKCIDLWKYAYVLLPGK
jgi:hypothetical protein